MNKTLRQQCNDRIRLFKQKAIHSSQAIFLTLWMIVFMTINTVYDVIKEYTTGMK